MLKEEDTQIPTIKKSKINDLNRQIPPEAHTPMYVWHKYWARKTWNVVAEFIKTYCPEDGIVFDPFAGSGVTAMEALKHKRRVIVSDLLPIATEIIRLTIKPVSLMELQKAFKRVESKVRNKILSLYLTKCRKCKTEFPFNCAIWNKGKYQEIRYQKCPQCGNRQESNCHPNTYDKELLAKIGKSAIKEWHPKNKLYYPDGSPFKTKHKYESLDELFTKRNLQALAWLMEAIESEDNKTIRDFLKIAFSSMVHLCTKMMPAIKPTAGSHQTAYSSTWSIHTYWFAPSFMEQNVWDKFKSSILGHQGLIKAKEESNSFFSNIKFAQDFRDVIDKKADVFIYTGSSFDLMSEMKKEFGDSGGVDYIFTDPPYDASIQYGELAYLWVAWLKKDNGYLEKLLSDEVVRNEKQGKSFNSYHSLLRRSFEDMHSILKPDKYLTVTFHNPTFKVRNATIYAGVFAGFEYEKIHHQPLGQVSAKAMLDPYGSAQGDFYLRFRKLSQGESVKPQTIDESRFGRIVTETTTRVLAERGEPTPYTIIINAIDPELARHGFFSELNTGLDVKKVLQAHLDKDFVLIPMIVGFAKGQLWWFKDISKIAHLQTVPLSERVERTVLRKLQQRGKVTFTEMWDAVSMEFPNSLTSDNMSIKEALKVYAREIPGGSWMINSDALEENIEREHTTMIAILAEIGRAKGFDIWIGRIEQNHILKGILDKIDKTGPLKQYVTLKGLTKIINIQQPDIVETVDLLWIKNNKVHCVFEIESTTSMTSALQRGSNIDNKVNKYLVIPEDREKQLENKLKSPMFAERFKDDKWNVLFFAALKQEFTRSSKKKLSGVDITGLINKKLQRVIDKITQKVDQSVLFCERDTSHRGNGLV
ncbi:MAG: DNA methyltransferase [Planctomycetota bacterium]|nr:DNA methyltransferase [Planctomycetota bacterium]MDI6787198.1 DNA methyltransferase [Planctomycetota bacterium]